MVKIGGFVKDNKNRLYIIVKIDNIKKKAIMFRIYNSKKTNALLYEYKNNNKIYYVEYNKFDIISIYKLEECILFNSDNKLVKDLLQLREKNRDKIAKINEKKEMMDAVLQNSSGSNKQMRGVHDSSYKGKITIVRG